MLDWIFPRAMVIQGPMTSISSAWHQREEMPLTVHTAKAEAIWKGALVAGWGERLNMPAAKTQLGIWPI
jgi:hypothetical protein